MPPTTLRLTAQGERKLQNCVNAAFQAARAGLRREVTRMRTDASQAAPSPEEEARLLSRGVIQSGRLSGITAGVPEGGRFMREGLMSMSEAIRLDPVVEGSTDFGFAGSTIVLMGTGDPTQLNRLTGFFWRTRRRGMQGPTFPFNQRLAQAYEFGGLVWIVVPRPGTRALEPEQGVLAQRMAKTVPPFAMYRRARLGRRAQAVNALRQDIRQRVQVVGRA